MVSVGPGSVRTDLRDALVGVVLSVLAELVTVEAAMVDTGAAFVELDAAAALDMAGLS